MERESQTRLRLCTKCGYLLSGLPQGKECPECNSTKATTVIPSLLPGRINRLRAGSRLIAISYAVLFIFALIRVFNLYYFRDLYTWLLDSYPNYEPQLYRVYEFFQYTLPWATSLCTLFAVPIWLAGWLTSLSRKNRTPDSSPEEESKFLFKLAVWSLAALGFFYSLILGVFFAEKLLLFTVFAIATAYFVHGSSSLYLKIASCVPDSKLARSIRYYRLFNYCAIAIAVGCVVTILVAAANPNPALSNGVMYHVGPPMTGYDIAARWAYRVLYYLPVIVFAQSFYTTLRVTTHLRIIHKATISANA